MKRGGFDVDVDSLTSDFEKMRIGKVSLKLKDVTKRLKSRIKGRSIHDTTFPYTIPDTRTSLLSVSKGAASTLLEKRTRRSCREKSSKKSGFSRVSRHVSQALKLDFGDGPITPNSDRVETMSIKEGGTKDRLSSSVKRDPYSPTPSLSECELNFSPVLSNMSSPLLPNLSGDTQTAFDSDSFSSVNDTLVAVDKFVDFYPKFSLGEPFNITSAYDILPAMPKFSDSIDSISVDFFSLQNFQYPIITF